MFGHREPEHTQPNFETLYCDNSDAIFRFCYRLCGNRTEAEDLTQEVFVAALEGLHRFERRSSEKTWLYRIAVYRHRARRERHETKNLALDSAPEGSCETDLWRIVLQDAIVNLSPSQREAFVLVKCEGLTCSEAAKVLRIPTGTLKFRVHCAVQSLQNTLREAHHAL
jgi:RNA polymerase sigma-70 factor (ECF subfamily)